MISAFNELYAELMDSGKEAMSMNDCEVFREWSLFAVKKIAEAQPSLELQVGLANEIISTF